MNIITEAKFESLSAAKKLAIAKLSANQEALLATMAQCDPHAGNDLSIYDDVQLVELAESHFIMGGELFAQ